MFFLAPIKLYEYHQKCSVTLCTKTSCHLNSKTIKLFWWQQVLPLTKSVSLQEARINFSRFHSCLIFCLDWQQSALPLTYLLADTLKYCRQRRKPITFQAEHQRVPLLTSLLESRDETIILRRFFSKNIHVPRAPKVLREHFNSRCKSEGKDMLESAIFFFFSFLEQNVEQVNVLSNCLHFEIFGEVQSIVNLQNILGIYRVGKYGACEAKVTKMQFKFLFQFSVSNTSARK